MPILKRLTVSTTLVACVAACGGGTVKSAQERFEEDFLAIDAQAASLIDTPGTKFTAMPSNGAAEFEGAAVIVILPDEFDESQDIIVIGDAEITADFEDATLTGEVTNLEAGTNFVSDTNYDVVNVEGTVEIGGEQSQIGVDPDDNLQDRPNQWFADYSGDLEIQGDTYSVGGTLLGDFRGTRSNPEGGQSVIKGLVGSSPDGYAAINGNIEEVPAPMVIIGTNN